jgi:hypothetical protein
LNGDISYDWQKFKNIRTGSSQSEPVVDPIVKSMKKHYYVRPWSNGKIKTAQVDNLLLLCPYCNKAREVCVFSQSEHFLRITVINGEKNV